MRSSPTWQVPAWEYALKAGLKVNPSDKFTVKGSQFETPLLEFSGACAGCGETPYVKLITQLFGSRMMIANASGCSSVWGGTSTTNPYTVDKDGRGPAWGRSLFEDNAEFGLGMALASLQRRDALRIKVSNWIISSACHPLSHTPWPMPCCASRCPARSTATPR
jgi:pyruvate-ferredoxin/flavodoxin oxidoreductase